MNRIDSKRLVLLLGLCLLAGLGPTRALAEETAEVPADRPAPKGALARFTTAVENREPIDSVTFLEGSAERIFFFTDLRNMNGDTVTHRWEHGGEVMAEVAFEVRSDRYRVWSSKTLRPEWLGEWRVSVVTGAGEVLASEAFTFQSMQH
jgi:hypothetical protein